MENEILLDKIGYSKTQNLINDCCKIFKENLIKEYPNYFNTPESCKALSVVSVVKNNEIKSIGMSCINDLLNTNWGRFIAAVSSSGGVSLFDTGGTPRTCGVYTATASLFTTDLVSIGTLAQVGVGLTPATRSDLILETPFTNGGAEDNGISTGDGGWNSGLGKVDIPTLISPTAGNGAISESVLYGIWADTGNNARTFLISRDNISPVVNFLTGLAINIDYSMVFN